MESDNQSCIVSTTGFLDVFINEDGVEETAIYTNTDELADALDADADELKQIVGAIIPACTGVCVIIKRPDPKTPGNIIINCKNTTCHPKCACHVIKIFINAKGKVDETDLGSGPLSYTPPPKGGPRVAHTCRCV